MAKGQTGDEGGTGRRRQRGNWSGCFKKSSLCSHKIVGYVALNRSMVNLTEDTPLEKNSLPVSWQSTIAKSSQNRHGTSWQIPLSILDLLYFCADPLHVVVTTMGSKVPLTFCVLKTLISCTQSICDPSSEIISELCEVGHMHIFVFRSLILCTLANNVSVLVIIY